MYDHDGVYPHKEGVQHMDCVWSVTLSKSHYYRSMKNSYCFNLL